MKGRDLLSGIALLAVPYPLPADAAIGPGDVASRWYDLRAQISAGGYASMSDILKRTQDTGGFALEDRSASNAPKPADRPMPFIYTLAVDSYARTAASCG